MKLVSTTLLSAALLLGGCATHDANKGEAMAAKAPASAIEQAQADLDAAKAVGGHWRVIDKATGGKAQNLSKLLKAAEKKAEAGDTAEADRIAAKVSKFAKLGSAQAKRYKGSLPAYQ